MVNCITFAGQTVVRQVKEIAMKQVFLTMALILAVTAGCAARQPRGTTHSLFNGKDLSGWVVMHGGEWSVEDGVLIGRNGKNWSTNPEESGSWLRSEFEYDDFILDFEYAIHGNSGVFLRSAHDKNPAFTGYEMQLLSDHGREPAIWSSGGLYDVVAASKNMSRPAGEWNHVRILYEGDRIQIIWNDELVVDFHEATRSRRGYIGLQNHDEKSVVKFRNIYITEL
jgi:hypothetical protein